MNYGGKRRLAPAIWERLGNPQVYAEPFAGSLACLLARPGGAGQREVVCDLDGGIANWWRAVTANPEQVAFWADHPTIHQDLTARHTWLRSWFAEHRDQLSADPEFYDPKVAGWWVWGISLWIGGSWCHVSTEVRPHVDASGGGRGVSAQSTVGKRPHVKSHSGGQGVSAQTTTRPDLIDWFSELQTRLKSVVVLNRGWESALTPTMIQQTPSGANATVGVLLDPPYRLDTGRNGGIYVGDDTGDSTDVAVESYRWAVEHGDSYRIAYCCHEHDFVVPDGWTQITKSLAGIRNAERSHVQDQIMFSPACEFVKEPEPEATLF